jgi:hypothetical protein
VTHEASHAVQRMVVNSRVASTTRDCVLLHDGHSRLRMKIDLWRDAHGVAGEHMASAAPGQVVMNPGGA